VVAFQFETNRAANELFSFLKPLRDCQMRRGIRFNSSQGSSDGTDRCVATARPHSRRLLRSSGLMCAGGSGPPHRQNLAEIAHELGIHVITLYKWRKTWRLPRLAGARRIRAGR
jgi:hypothetical protein